jgi:hypothetical protein
MPLIPQVHDVVLTSPVYFGRVDAEVTITSMRLFKYVCWQCQPPMIEPNTRTRGVVSGARARTFAGWRRARPITTKECERLKVFLKRGDTPRGKPRSGTTINRYIYLLSAVCSRAIAEERLNSNPCIRITDEPEKGRERYLTSHEHTKLRAVLESDLDFPPVAD